MDKKIKKALKEVAKKNGVSLAEVQREIEAALTVAQADPASQAAWAAIPHKGKQPTSEEVIAHLAKKVSSKNK